MARLLPLALALCGSPYCATPEPEAPAYSYAHNAHSGQVVSAVTRTYPLARVLRVHGHDPIKQRRVRDHRGEAQKPF